MEELPSWTRLACETPSLIALGFALGSNPGLIRRYLEAFPLPEGASRVAIPLRSEGSRVPYLVFTREGVMVDCLWRGDSPGDLPVITPAQIASLPQELSARLAKAWKQEEQGGLARRLKPLLHNKERFSREDFLALLPWQPLLEQTLFRMQFSALKKLEEGRDWLERNPKRGPKYMRALEAYHSLLFAAGNLVVLTSMRGPQPWRHRVMEHLRNEPIDAFTLLLSRHGVAPLTLRSLWGVGRMGALYLPLYQSMLRSSTSLMEVQTAILGLLMLALAQPELSAEVRATLEPQDKTTPWFRASEGLIRAMVKMTLDRAEGAKPDHQSIGRELGVTLTRRLSVTSPYKFQRPEDVPDEIAFPLALEAVEEQLVEDMKLPDMLLTLPWLAKAQPASLYLPRAFIEAVRPPWEPEQTLAILRRFGSPYQKQGSPSGKESPFPPYARTTKREPGRNELCPCGSGKKYKKCCGLN